MSKITEGDVYSVALSINVVLNSNQIMEALIRYPFEEKQDPTGNCREIVEKIVYDLVSEAEFELTKLVDKTIERIKQDIIEGDVTAIDELLRYAPIENLKGYLAED